MEYFNCTFEIAKIWMETLMKFIRFSTFSTVVLGFHLKKLISFTVF